MGIGYTIDTPLKVSHLGIDSVISLVDDELLEKIRKMYCGKYALPYTEIPEKENDYRAKRITSYLNLINELATRKFEELKLAGAEQIKELKVYVDMLPDLSSLKEEFNKCLQNLDFTELKKIIREKLHMGSIDVNIMTKVDKDNYRNNEKLPVEFNDAHAALRGYANSDLNSSVILSAGMNPRLYSYFENFEQFYPDADGLFKKKIVLKVSDYRSAMIQGMFLAKKGLWVSEYRIESGLNCGGHAFATDGYLMGPILEEFKTNRQDLINSVHEIFVRALQTKNRLIPESPLLVKITAQGGVGTADEHQFLLDHYSIDSVGWGSPFLLVPEATSVDTETLKRLADALEEDLYLSNISPLGIPFNNLRGNTKDLEKLEYIRKDRPGSPCPKKHVALNTELTEKGICTASRQYQNLRIIELDKQELSKEEHQISYDSIVEKSCICVGLGTSILLANNLDTKTEGKGVSICPGPNMAYFERIYSLKEMTDHIYGRTNILTRKDRPHMFVKELNIYIEYLQKKIKSLNNTSTPKQITYLINFAKNLEAGINYYVDLFTNSVVFSTKIRSEIILQLNLSREHLKLSEKDLDKFIPVNS